MEKLIITCCTNDIPFWQGVKGLEHMPATVRELADSIHEVCDAGAAAVHVHEPIADRTLKHTAGGEGNIEGWLELIQLVRQKSDVIFEHGQGGFPYYQFEHHIPEDPPEIRQRKFDSYMAIEKPDMIATFLGPIHHTFGGPRGIYTMPTREEMEHCMHLCLDNGVKPAFEVWTIGDYNNLRYLADKGLVKQPYWLTLFFGTEGSGGSPPTLKELLHRVENLPEHSVWQASVWAGLKGIATIEQHLALFADAIAMGGNVRLGMEDNPYYWEGVPAKSNAQLVERIVRMAREIGREIATPDEARKILGIPPRKK